MGDVFEGLNPQQVEAVRQTEGAVLVLAGAGSGKTRILARRVAYLVGDLGVEPWHVLAVTFTNKAAREMRHRVEAMAGGRLDGMWMGTFHSICLRVLRREVERVEGVERGFVIYDEADQLRAVRGCLEEMNLSDKVFEPRSVKSYIERAKSRGVGPAEAAEEARGEVWKERAAAVYGLYQEALRRANALDFGDLILEAVRLLERNDDLLRSYASRFRYIHVDEFQDTNALQYRLLRLLASAWGNLFAVGDDSQSIYGWRGADVGNMASFLKDHPDAKLIKLERNYRSSATIIEAANELIRRNRPLGEKRLWTERGAGEPIVWYEAFDGRDEARWVAEAVRREVESGGRRWGDVAVFFRTNSQSRLFEEEFMARAVPYTVVGAAAFYSRAEIKDALAYVKVALNPRDDVSLARIVNTPPRGIGKISLERLRSLARSRGVALIDAMERETAQQVLKGRALASAVELRDKLLRLGELASGAAPGEFLRAVLDEVGYFAHVEGDEERRSNIDELINVAYGYEKTDPEPTVAGFLDAVSLVSDADALADGSPGVRLMTVHAAKGLEFPVVFVVGLEEGLFPHARSRNAPAELEEERRLFYVALTRAEDKVVLTSAARRMLWGKEKAALPSRFIGEIPERLIRVEGRPHDRPSPPGGRVRPQDGAVSEGAAVYVPGMRVEHEVFGTGYVKRVEGRGREAKVTVFFRSVGPKRIAASFPGLRAAD